MIYTSITNSYDKPRKDVKVFSKYNKFKDPRMNAKIYKCLPHLFMPEEEWWIWVDGNLKLKVSEEELIKLAGKSDVTVFENPYRDTVGEEMQEIIDLELDDEETVKKQRYYKDGHLAACFLIIRKNTPEVRKRNEMWWSEICAGSVRDQISFPHCFWNISKYLPKEHPFDNKYFSRHGHERPRPIQKAGQKD